MIFYPVTGVFKTILEALVPLLLPFIIGLLIGVIFKKAMSLIILGVALIVVLIATGAISITYTELFDEALSVLPKLWNGASGWVGVLPYSSVGFIVGLVLGLVWG